jgi:hypothetical protein
MTVSTTALHITVPEKYFTVVFTLQKSQAIVIHMLKPNT